MQFLLNAQISEGVPCPYLKGQTFIQEYFFAHNLSEEEWEEYLIKGWRRFGLYFFRPACELCSACTPIRVLTGPFLPTRSQRRVIKKNDKTQMEVSPLFYDSSHYQLYLKHSNNRFKEKNTSEEQFYESFYAPAAPSVLTQYTLDGVLIGLGYLDISKQGASSVYYIFDTDYSYLSLGTYSILREIELCRLWQKEFYYLGYYIENNRSMNYKNRFKPNQLMEWKGYSWKEKVS